MPLAYLTVWELTKSTGAAVLGTAFIVFGKLIKLKPTPTSNWLNIQYIKLIPGLSEMYKLHQFYSH